jgi:hypothetical protein
MRQLGSVDILRIQIEIVIKSEPRDLYFARAIPDFRLLVDVWDSPAVNVNRARTASNPLLLCKYQPLDHAPGAFFASEVL